MTPPLPAVATAALAPAGMRQLAVQLVFLGTGVFSTCAAQYAFYEGAGDQRAMLLPLCNYLGMMLSGLAPAPAAAASAAIAGASAVDKKAEAEPADDEPERTGRDTEPAREGLAVALDAAELTRRQTGEGSAHEGDAGSELSTAGGTGDAGDADASLVIRAWRAQSPVQSCVAASAVLDLAGCVFSNLGLSMAGSGLFQVAYSSVICWSALLSRLALKKRISRDQWLGIALVTLGLAFSALGESAGGRSGNRALVLMGCFNTLVGAAFYGGNYVTGEYMLKLPERPQPRELCLKIGAACAAIVAAYQLVFVLPQWRALVAQPIADAGGNTMGIVAALAAYTLSQLAHGMTYFMLLDSSGAVTTGIMQSLRAVCVFGLSSLLFCARQESQCFDARRGVSTLLVISGVLFYSWAKAQRPVPQVAALAKTKVVAGKSYVV